MKGVKDGEQRSIKKAKKRGEEGEGPRTCDGVRKGNMVRWEKKELRELESRIQGHFTVQLKPG